jgi:cell division protein FtsB
MSREKESINPLTVVIIIVSILMIGSMVRNALSLYQARHRLDTANQTVAALETKKTQVADQITIQTDPTALDQAIRNNFNLVQPGETIVMIVGSDSGKLDPVPLFTPQASPIPPIRKWWAILNPPKL